ncbi:MAG: hypothetical protein IH969_05510 [Candidatus Krumholzibacteriota bacterium]|nr:hypothetical protein [Candidatus Krumholzibacteriota bacterium]
MRKTITLGTLIIALAAGAGRAHPGHGSDPGSFSVFHYVSEPEHMGLTALIILGVTGVLVVAFPGRRPAPEGAAHSRFPL